MKPGELASALIANTRAYAAQKNAIHELAWQQTSLPKAAVLVALLPSSDQPRVILTLRSHKLTAHPGEVALPGGKAEASDKSPINTALREAEEEIGLFRDHLCDDFCLLKPIISRYGMIVFPVISTLKTSFVPTESHAEVLEVFMVPLDAFLSRQDHVTVHISNQRRADEDLFVQHEFYYRGYRIWALTAHVLICAASVVHGREPDFSFDYSLYSKSSMRKSKL